MAIVGSESAEAADAVFRAQKSVDASRTLVRQAVRRLVLRQHRNHLAWLRLLTLPIIIRDLVHHPDYGLDTNEFALLLYKVFQVSPPMALHLLNLIGLAGPGWVMGVIADNRSADCYAREIYAAMMNFGTLDDSRLEKIKNPYERLVIPLGRISWVMDLMRHDDSRLYDFGSQLMLRLLEKNHVAPGSCSQPADFSLGSLNCYLAPPIR